MPTSLQSSHPNSRDRSLRKSLGPSPHGRPGPTAQAKRLFRGAGAPPWAESRAARNRPQIPSSASLFLRVLLS